MPSWSKHDASMTVLCALLYHLCFYARPGAEFMKHFEFRSRLQKRKEKKILSACQSAEFSLTMWTKSMGVAVYKSQCSLSRMILSMRRISAVEKLHPLCTTRSLTEPITSSSSLILAARTSEVKAMHFRYFVWAFTVDSRRLRTHTPSAKVSGQKRNSLFISPSQRIISWCWDEEMSAPWMHPFLKTGTFQRRASRTRAASSRPSSRRLSAAPGFFITSTAQARLHPGHTHLCDFKSRVSLRRQVHLYSF